jgi:acyl dehydratase
VRTFTTAEELASEVGHDLGHSDWLEITQERVDLFAEATGDHQWIHVDPERADEGPFGGTIAHGWLSASLLPVLTQQIYRVQSRMGVNYGLDKLRFPAPVKVGTRVRAQSSLVAVDEVAGGAVQLSVSTTIAAEGAAKPALVAQTLSRYYW